MSWIQARIMAVARAETVPLKESLIADPDTASLLGSIICDSYNATITGTQATATTN
jgi:hypothetical protein